VTWLGGDGNTPGLRLGSREWARSRLKPARARLDSRMRCGCARIAAREGRFVTPVSLGCGALVSAPSRDTTD